MENDIQKIKQCVLSKDDIQGIKKCVQQYFFGYKKPSSFGRFEKDDCNNIEEYEYLRSYIEWKNFDKCTKEPF